MIAGQRDRNRRGKGGHGDLGDAAEQRRQRRRRRSSQPQAKSQKPPDETILKLGRFKFSFESGNKQGGRKGDSGSRAADGPPTAAAAARQQSSHIIRQRKKSSPAKMNEAASMAVAAESAVAKGAGAEMSRSPPPTVPPPPPPTAEAVSRRGRYGRSVSMDGPHPVIVEEGGQRQQQQQPVLLSRKPLPDRPLWQPPERARKSPETENLLKSQPTSPMTAKPPSGGGNGNSDTIDLIMGGIGRRARPGPPRKYSFANEQRPDLEKLYQLKRSNTIKEEGSLCGDSVKDSR